MDIKIPGPRNLFPRNVSDDQSAKNFPLENLPLYGTASLNVHEFASTGFILARGWGYWDFPQNFKVRIIFILSSH